MSCKSTHNPDSTIIDTNSWNRSKVLDGVYSIGVRGSSTNTEAFGLEIKKTSQNFDVVNRIWDKAIQETCINGLQQVISKKEEIKHLQMPNMGIIPGMVFAEPWIHSVIQCIGSKATQEELEQRFFQDEIQQKKSMLNLINNLSKKLANDMPQ